MGRNLRKNQNRPVDRVKISRVRSTRPKGGNRHVSQRRNEPEEENTLEKASYLSEYTKYTYDQSIDRFGRIDSKASSLLSVTIIVVGIVLSLGDWWVYTELSTPYEWFFSIISWVLVASVLVSAGVVIWYCIKTLKVHNVPVPPLTEEVMEYVYRHSLIDSYGGTASTLYEANMELTEIMAKKGKDMAVAYTVAVLLMIFTGLSFIAAIIRMIVL